MWHATDRREIHTHLWLESVGRRCCKTEDTDVDLYKLRWDNVDLIYIGQDRKYWRTYLIVVMNFRFP